MKNLKSSIDYFDESSTMQAYFKDRKVKKRALPLDLQSTKSKDSPPAKMHKLEFYSKMEDKYIQFRQYNDEDVFPVIPKGLVSRRNQTDDDDRDSTQADIQHGINLFVQDIKQCMKQEEMALRQEEMKTRQRSRSPLYGGRQGNQRNQRNQRNKSII